MLNISVVFKICYDKVIFSKDLLRIRGYYDEINSENETKTVEISHVHYYMYIEPED